MKKNEINKNNLKCAYIMCSPSEVSTINTASCEIYINTAREDSVLSLLKSCLDLNFEVLHAANGNRIVDVKDIRLKNLGPIAFLVFVC